MRDRHTRVNPFRCAAGLSAGVLLLMTLACSSRPAVTRYSRERTAASGDATPWRAVAAKHVKLQPIEGSWDDSRRLKAGDGNRIAGLLFSLKSIPAGAQISRAVVRLRRRRSTGSPGISAMNINKGLKVIRFGDGDRLYGILRARLTRDKAEMLRVGFDDDTDKQVSGLALTAYPVQCSIPSEGYKAGLLAEGKPYCQLLEKWNQVATPKSRLAGAWDEVDVTAFAKKQFAGDKWLLTGFKITGGSLEWFAAGKRNPWASPHLIVEYSGAAVQTSVAPSPGPKTEPKPKSEPKPKPVAGKGRVVIGSQPARADIYVNGKYVGTTPSRELSFPAGEIKVRIEKKGYKAWERKVTILTGNVISVAPELEKK
jgi:PEGA domain